jgi:hypothetical protein
MSHEAIGAIRSLVSIGIFLLAVSFCVPRSVKSWKLWKENDKYVHLSNAVAAGIVAFFLLAANFVMFMKAVLGLE